MNQQLALIAERIRELREILRISVEEMASITDLTPEKYLEMESGAQDYSFTFLFKCANRFGVDLTELVTGDRPKLSLYSLIRRGDGLPIKRREGFQYQSLAYLFKDRMAEPFVVTAPYSEKEQNEAITMSRHEGQEFDYVLSGSLRFEVEGHTEVLNEGDCVFYDSGHRHGMIATGGGDCSFLAIVMKKKEGAV